jgi:Tfp pilus assembly protein PilZ
MQVETKTLSLVVLSGDKEEEQAISQAISPLHVNLVLAPTLLHLRDTLFEQACNGILLCIPSLIGIDQTGKSFIQSLERVYPVVRIRWNRVDRSFTLMAFRNGRVETLADFIAICSGFSARRLRSCERLPKALNVLVSSTPDLANATRAHTTNIALRGCYLHTSQGWSIGDVLYLQIQELSGQSIIEGKVVRSVPWGTPFRAPGIGIQFVNMDDQQMEALRHLLYFLPAGLSE